MMEWVVPLCEKVNSVTVPCGAVHVAKGSVKVATSVHSTSMPSIVLPW